jgi:hypothetical protein
MPRYLCIDNFAKPPDMEEQRDKWISKMREVDMTEEGLIVHLRSNSIQTQTHQYHGIFILSKVICVSFLANRLSPFTEQRIRQKRTLLESHLTMLSRKRQGSTFKRFNAFVLKNSSCRPRQVRTCPSTLSLTQTLQMTLV